VAAGSSKITLGDQEAAAPPPEFGGRLLFGNSLWNLAGEGLPMLVAVFAMPVIIHGLGKPRFGILTISWMVVGYMSLLDMGLGRALTKYLAESIGRGRREQLPGLFWTAFILMLILGLFGMCALLLGSRWIVYHGLSVPPALRPETLLAFCLIALCVPALVSAAACRGLFAALQRFDLINAVRVPVSIFSYLAPVALMQVSRNLALIVGVLVAGRVVSWVVQMVLCFQVLPGLRRSPFLERRYLRPLFSFGGWFTVTTVVGPLLGYSERLLIGSLLSMTSVAYFSTPWEVIYKMQILPAAISQVMFPAFSYSLVASPKRMAALFEQTNKCVLALLFPFALLTAVFAPELLRLWLGQDFANASTVVARCFTAGLLLAGVTYVPTALTQAAGRPDLNAMLLLIETPLYLPLAWLAIRRFGINGAAVAFLVRTALNMIICFGFAMHVAPATGPGLKKSVMVIAAALCILAVGASMTGGLLVRAIFAAVALIISAMATWTLLLDQRERGFLLSQLSVIRNWT